MKASSLARSLGGRIGAALLLVAAGCTGAGSSGNGAASVAEFEQSACGLPPAQLQRILDGFDAERSGEIQIVPRAPNLVGREELSHAGPWAFLQRVPMLLYGPGHVPAVGSVERPVTMADVAPTLARYLHFDFDAPDGKPMEEAIVSGAGAPRLILVVVWDGGGRDVLETYPDAWPNLRRLIPRGAWYENATLGTSPSVTPTIHATLGTGANPRTHGLVDMRFDVDGRLVPSNDAGPAYLRGPTLADAWDVARGNAAEVGVVAFRTWHLGMIGHGSFTEGADRDLAVLLDESSGRWALEGPNREFYSFPDYANDVPGLPQAVRALDASDGQEDGRWLGEALAGNPESAWRTPAYAPWQTSVLEEIIRRGGFGADDVSDLLYTNYKQIDLAGHEWRLGSEQMEAAVAASDDALEDLIGVLNRRVGEGEWVIALTADHGVSPPPGASGGARLDNRKLRADLEEAFGGGDRPAIRAVRPTQIWVDRDALAEHGYTVEDVAAFLADYPGSAGAEPFFSAVFPGEILEGLTCPSGP